MLKSLHIKNYVLIDNQDIDFPDSLVVISGPTGAGKSILIGALGLLCGAKADPSVISAGADSCVVEGDFYCPSASLKALFEENDLDFNDGNITIRRVVSASSRSRSFVNDLPVNAPLLAAIGEQLVDIHSQHDTMLLANKAYQLSVLDAYAGNAGLLEKCAFLFQQNKSLLGRMNELSEQISRAKENSEYNETQYARLRDAALKDTELEELEAEHSQLSHSEQIKEVLSEMISLMDSDSSDAVNSSMSILSRDASRLSEYVPSFIELGQRLESARIELKDIFEEIETINEKIDCSPERLQFVEERLSLIYDLLKRYKVETVAQLIEIRDSLKVLTSGSEEMEQQLHDLQKEQRDIQAKLDAVCDELHNSRVKAAARFAPEVKHNLSFMELGKADFIVNVEPGSQTVNGSDDVQFLFNANGNKALELSRCASGGELSRIMLALKSVICKYIKIPTVVFDEIDTGVSGSVADEMGTLISRMGETMQVFAITHLPQVASKGESHFLVSKSSESGKTSSSIKKLSHEERVSEIARMLSGANLSDSAIANARTLLQN